jgi:phosphoribosylamine--glycine ligase
MKVLVVGSGGREHALAWKLSRSPIVSDLYCAPGNPGMKSIADCVQIDPSDLVEIADFVEKLSIELTVVGPELPLMLGLADELHKRDLSVFGPTRAAAELEGSKAFAKEFMSRHNIPTAKYRIASSLDEAEAVLKSGEIGWPLVVKADGLAAGKGVVVAADEKEARAAIDKLMKDRAHGSAGDRLVLEECLVGDEVSFFALSDGGKVLPLASAQDHKAAFDDDKGPNTGGMGCISPATVLNAETLKRVLREIVFPTISGMADDGRRYQGILYCGLMITKDGPKVLEYNVRFGDPEAQVILPRLRADLLPLLKEAADGQLGQHKLEWSREPAVTVVMASGGYPDHYETGKPIKGLANDRAVETAEATFVFHAGTKVIDDQLVTGGGRVLGVTGLGQNLKQAIEQTYQAVSGIQFEGVHYRKDIGRKALARITGGV